MASQMVRWQNLKLWPSMASQMVRRKLSKRRQRARQQRQHRLLRPTKRHAYYPRGSNQETKWSRERK
jgi:hypothetical protein